MAWTTPKTWASEPLTSVDLNTYIRDNQNSVKSRLDNVDSYVADESSDYTTTSTTFVDMDATNLSLTITTTEDESTVLVGFHGYGGQTATSNRAVHFNIDVDGSPYVGDDGLTSISSDAGTGERFPISFVVPITGLSAGSHTFKLQWKVHAGAGLIYAGAGTSNRDLHPIFWVKEV